MAYVYNYIFLIYFLFISILQDIRFLMLSIRQLINKNDRKIQIDTYLPDKSIYESSAFLTKHVVNILHLFFTIFGINTKNFGYLARQPTVCRRYCLIFFNHLST